MRYLVVLLLCVGNALHAQTIIDCEERAALSEMYSAAGEKLRTFANGDVEISIIDTGEQNLANVYLKVVSPPRDDLGLRQCRLIGAAQDKGFAGMNINSMESSYDPATGLQLSMIIRTYDPASETLPRRFLFFTVNQATGQITADVAADGL
ncbi:MAG: hypothetical protein AAGF56_04475 [Pseudomonadota bacterium]